MSMSIFERASRAKLRFASPVWALTTEQLWDLPLKVRNPARPDLNSIAREVYLDLKGIDEVSFVEEKPDPRRDELELMLEVVKHVIESKKADAARAARAADAAERRRKLLDALAAKDDADLAGMSREQIQAEIARLGEGG